MANKSILYYSNSCSLHDAKFIKVLCGAFSDVVVVSRSACFVPKHLAGKVRFISLSRCSDEPLKEVSVVKRLEEIFRATQPHVVVAGPLWPCAYEAAKAKAKRLIAVSWAFDILVDTKKSTRVRRAVTTALSEASMVLFDSPWIYSEARKLCPLSKGRVRIFPWGVNTRLFRPDARSKKWQIGIFEILHTRTLAALYRPEKLLRALKLALRKRPDFQLTFMACGPLLQQMQALSRTLGVDKRVRWLKPLENSELPDIFRGASLYTSAAISDGVSISLLEAMACGLPTAVPDLPSNKHLLGPGYRRQTFRLDDINSIATTWLAIAGMPSKHRSAIGKANRRKVSKGADLKQFESNFFELVGTCCRLAA